MKLKHVFPTLIIFSIIAASCSSNTKNNTEPAEGINKAFLQNVKTAKATLTNQNKELTLTGKVEYDPDKVVTYVPLISGVVQKTYFSLGDKVQKGQTLLDIRSSDLSSLQSEYISHQSDVALAERELQTAQSMYDDKMLSERDLLEAKGKVKQAQAALNKVKGDMSTFGANKGNGLFAIQSPMSGYIVDKKVSAGSPVSSDSEPLFIVADLNDVWITANVYAGNLQAVKEGLEVDITTLSYPGEVFTGTINALSQVFDSEEKVLKARVIMSNKDLKFKPEMSVVVKLKDQLNEKLVAIPSDALVFDADRYFVVIENSPEKFEIKEVTLQGHNRDMTYIRSGLNEGDNVVIKNQLLIYSGLKED